MRKFDTKVQHLKYKVLREVARYGFEDNLDAAYYEIPKLIVKEKPTMRCCIYKERAIVAEHAFGESVLQIEPALTDGRWQLLAADGSTPLRHAPTLPLTLTERRWQKAKGK